MLVTEPAPSIVISNQSFAPGVDAIVPCTLKSPVKFLVYTAIVCNALLLFKLGLASMDHDVYSSGPLFSVKLDIDVLALNCG